MDVVYERQREMVPSRCLRRGLVERCGRRAIDDVHLSALVRPGRLASATSEENRSIVEVDGSPWLDLASRGP